MQPPPQVVCNNQFTLRGHFQHRRHLQHGPCLLFVLRKRGGDGATATAAGAQQNGRRMSMPFVNPFLVKAHATEQHPFNLKQFVQFSLSRAICSLLMPCNGFPLESPRRPLFVSCR